MTARPYPHREALKRYKECLSVFVIKYSSFCRPFFLSKKLFFWPHRQLNKFMNLFCPTCICPMSILWSDHELFVWPSKFPPRTPPSRSIILFVVSQEMVGCINILQSWIWGTKQRGSTPASPRGWMGLNHFVQWTRGKGRGVQYLLCIFVHILHTFYNFSWKLHQFTKNTIQTWEISPDQTKWP